MIKSLIPAMAQQRGNDELVLFYNQEKFWGLAPDCHEIVIKGNNRLWWDQMLLPRMLHKLKIDAIICPKNITSFLTKCRCYLGVTDLAFFDRQLNAYPFLDTIYMRTLVPFSVRKAAAIFAISENTKKDIIRYSHCNPEKIIVTYLAADKIYQPINDTSHLQEIKQKYRVPDNFIMYVGSLSPRKNINRLLEAFWNVRKKVPHNLVLTASKSWKDSSVYKSMVRLNLQDRIHKLGYVDHEDMPALYNLADAYIYPSLYEGFGLPILEAMQCGCPVVASNATSIPEVAGDAAILVDPLDTAALADAIQQVLTNPGIREKLISAGFQQARKFSWDTCAKIMLDTIRRNKYQKFS